MIYSGNAFYVSLLHPNDALGLNKLLVTNTELFKRFMPSTIAANRTLQDTQSYIALKTKSVENKQELIFTLKAHKTNSIAGLIILKDINWDKKKGELAYCLGQDFQGEGWMYKAVQAVSNYTFKTLNLNNLQIVVYHKNTASINVAERAGFRWKKTLKHEFTSTNNPPLDMELYEQKNTL